ncbi:hypothetical protein H0176_24170 [Methylorubrum populi]|uniref:Uncharacterized protein n=1 Tax=Methylorubrum rhodesianum TaxID=29427 RepID=A0ABU9Z593_9HYPH|nr:hypothetical protein [Methylorubrum rhodesianum]MBK3403251.1 hypothetical protein [Methylorubrum rhodesianum]MBY0143335.1 hypothetical protein [Methylorubrum populi]
MAHFYICDSSGFGRFPLRVLEAFESREALMSRLVELTAEPDDYAYELNYVSSATHIATSELKIAPEKCLPIDRMKASDIRHGPASPEALPVIRAFAARIDRVRD